MFEVGQLYRRRDLHEQYGGQQQGGIITPAGQPFNFLITGEGGLAYGYADGWDDSGTFRYYGEGQVGDMQFVRGNASIRDHAEAGKDLHLFEKVPPAHLRYLGQMVCAGYELVPDTPDREGTMRTAIVFRLVGLDGSPEEAGENTDEEGDQPPEAWFWARPLEELRDLARQSPTADATPQQARRNVYRRSGSVRVYVLRRAEGRCEGCGADAPFVTGAGRPYLEPHHTRRISDGGPDDPAWVIALCPTCHRRAHHAADHALYNETLIEHVNALEVV